MTAFDKRMIMVILVVLAFAVLTNPQYNLYEGLSLIGVVIYLYYASNEAAYINDRKELYVTARLSPGGANRMPDWREIEDDNLSTHERGDLILYQFVWKGKQKAICLDKRADGKHSIFHDDYSVNIQDLDPGTQIKWLEEEAYGKNEYMTEEKVRKWLDNHGYKMIAVDKNKKLLDNDRTDER